MRETGDIRIDILLFSVGGVHFGVEAAQVAEIALFDGEQGEDLFWFHEEFEYKVTSPVYVSPTVVTIRTGNDRPYRVIIDKMEDVSEFSLNDIRLFPVVLEPFAARSGMWGILWRNGSAALLVDFQCVARKRS